jgi:peptide/nickel transport system substrate-binding protein
MTTHAARRPWLPIVAGLALLALALPAAGQETPVRGGQIVMALETDPGTLNPVLFRGGTEYDLDWALYDSLVELGPDLRPRPLLAKAWTVSPDGLTYTFQLKETVKWHDGQPFTAEDVAFTFYAHLNPKVNSTLRSALGALQGFEELTHKDRPADPKSLRKPPIEVVDPLTVRFNLRFPNAAFLTTLVNPQAGIAPRHLLDGKDINTAPLNQRPVGTGPFKFVEWQRSDRLVVEAFDQYHQGRPYLDRVIFRIIPEMAVRVSQLQSRQIDFVRSPASDAIPALQKNPRLQTLFGDDVNWRGLAFNLKNPVLQDRRVRQAVCYAIDRATITQTLGRGYQTVATGPIPPQSWAYNPEVNRYPYDPARAAALLKEAGWTPGSDGVLAKGTARLSFGTDVEIYENLPDIVVAIQGQLKQVGVEVRPQPYDFNAWLDRLRKGQYDLSFTAWAGSPDPDNVSYTTFQSTGTRNLNGYSNPAVDDLLEKARRAQTVAERKRFYGEFQRTLADEAPYCFLYHQQRWYAFGKEYRGFEYLGVSVGVIQSLRRAWIAK